MEASEAVAMVGFSMSGFAVVNLYIIVISARTRSKQAICSSYGMDSRLLDEVELEAAKGGGCTFSGSGFLLLSNPFELLCAPTLLRFPLFFL